jgi:hypothetical protein
MKALITFFNSLLKLMEQHQGEADFHIREGFYFQAFGAVTYETYKAIEEGRPALQCEAERLWEEEWRPEFEKALWGE